MAKEKIQTGRRKFVKGAIYVPPAILTLTVAPGYAKAGSEKKPPRVGPPPGVSPTIPPKPPARP